MTIDTKALCMALMLADTAVEVRVILNEFGLWNDDSAWVPFGNTENNFGQISNQQSDAIPALVEKLINCIDARLMALAAKQKITYESANCPRDMRQAIAQFVEGKSAPFKERDGNIYYWDDAQIKREAQNITLFATGKTADQGYPSLTISDTGEGQTPDRFPETLMSLSKNNKMRIPFVQGKFNMGGTGAFQFCSGDDNLQVQLVISRRDPELLGSSQSARDAQWGFSVVRRVVLPDMRNPLYQYLAPINKQVLSFESKTWPIFPSDDKERPLPYKKEADFGTLVKLYEYECKTAKTNLIMGNNSFKNRVEEVLLEAALPIQVLECRPHFSGRDRRSFVSEIIGAVTQISNSDKESRVKKLETKHPVTGVITLNGSPLPIQAYVFKEEPGTNPYNPQGLFFTINGQAHGTLPSRFFNRKKVNLSYIKDSLFVVIDCTNMESLTRNSLFMGSRDRMRSGPVADELASKIETFLSEDPTLREINIRRQQEKLKRNLEDQKPLEDTLRKLIKDNPQLVNLLPFGVRIPTPRPGLGTGTSGNSKFEGKRQPTFFRFKGNRSTLLRDSPINQSPRIGFETDADDEYLSRKSLRGELTIEFVNQNGTELALDYRVGNLREGVMSVSLDLDRKKVKVGDVLTCTFRIVDDSLLEPFVNSLQLSVLTEAEVGSPGGKGKDSSANNGKGKDGGSTSAGLPNITAVEEENWVDENFTADSALKIRSNPDGQGYDFYYNKDNRNLKAAQLASKHDPKVLDHQYKIGLMLIALALIDATKKDDLAKERQILSEEIDLENLITETTEAVSPYWLSILDALAGLKLQEETQNEE